MLGDLRILAVGPEPGEARRLFLRGDRDPAAGSERAAHMAWERISRSSGDRGEAGRVVLTLRGGGSVTPLMVKR